MEKQFIEAFTLSEERQARQNLKLARQTAFKGKYPNVDVRMAERISRLQADETLGVEYEICKNGHLTTAQLKRLNEFKG